MSNEDKMLNKTFFKHSWVINLDCRPERLVKAMKEFVRIGIKPERMPGLLFGNKWRDKRKGCALTHVKIWRLCQEMDVEMAVIFEDDVILHPRFNDLFPIVEKALGEKPWDMLLFDGNYKEIATPRTQEEIYLHRRFKYPRGTHAYAIRKRALPFLIKQIESRPFADVAVNMGHVFKKDIEVYAPNFKLATRGPSVSDIKGKKHMGNMDIAKDWYNLDREDYEKIARSQLDEMISLRSNDSLT